MRSRAPGPVILLAATLAGCGPTVWESTILPANAPEEVAKGDGYLKAHLISGDLVVFTDWGVPSTGRGLLEGAGIRYGPDRIAVGNYSQQALSLDSISLLESDEPETVARFGYSGLVVWSGLNGLISAACLSDPKSCFGSCPTFYADDPRGNEQLLAEGFSSSFAKVLEANDVDALPGWLSDRDTLSIVMRNEAHETHAVRQVTLLVVPRNGAEVVLATPDGRFRPALRVDEFSSCAVGGIGGADCTDAVQREDAIEYFSPASDSDLADREYLYLSPPTWDRLPVSADGQAVEIGLAIRARNTLLSTFLFYESIAALGSEAGTWLSELERGSPEVVERSLGLASEIGGIEVQIEGAEGWRTVGHYGEAGPIAADLQVVPFGVDSGSNSRVRLQMARGNWRIDRLALAWLEPEVEPTRVEPVRVYPLGDPVQGAGTETSAERDAGTYDREPAARLLDPSQYLVTQRGDAYRLDFDMTGQPGDVQLFLDSGGYYYEWMRGEWARRKDPLLAALIFSDPGEALRVMAPRFKDREEEMEAAFWSSRFRSDDQ